MIEGFDITVASDGAEGVSLAAACPFDLILMDLNLPVMSGWEAARRLKADARTAGIPVIALTAHAMNGDRERALAAGCDEFDTKPMDFDRLVQKIHNLVVP
jgi:two-component system, cell cycle response regulator DivK